MLLPSRGEPEGEVERLSALDSGYVLFLFRGDRSGKFPLI